MSSFTNCSEDSPLGSLLTRVTRLSEGQSAIPEGSCHRLTTIQWREVEIGYPLA